MFIKFKNVWDFVICCAIYFPFTEDVFVYVKDVLCLVHVPLFMHIWFLVCRFSQAYGQQINEQFCVQNQILICSNGCFECYYNGIKFSFAVPGSSSSGGTTEMLSAATKQQYRVPAVHQTVVWVSVQYITNFMSVCQDYEQVNVGLNMRTSHWKFQM